MEEASQELNLSKLLKICINLKVIHTIEITQDLDAPDIIELVRRFTLHDADESNKLSFEEFLDCY